MKKYKVKIDCDFIDGHLRRGHLEGFVEVENEEKLKKLIKDGSIDDGFYLIVDDYEVDYHSPNMDSLTYEEIKEGEENDE